MVVLTSELFGKENLQINYLFFDGCASAIGINCIANLLPRAFYHSSDGGHDCVGAHCFAPTHGIAASLCLTAVASAALLSCRSARLYREIGRSLSLRSGIPLGGKGAGQALLIKMRD